MITKAERGRFGIAGEDFEGQGIDCDGNIIQSGDKVEVVEEESARKGKPEYKFCSKGKIGIVKEASTSLYFINIELETLEGKKCIVSCVDYHTRLVN